MALVANDTAAQIIQFPDFSWLRFRSEFTLGAWCYFTSLPGGNRSLWRQDGTFTFLQTTPLNRVGPVWWNSAGNAQDQQTQCGWLIGTDFPLNTWVYFGLAYVANETRNAESVLYVPGQGVQSKFSTGASLTSISPFSGSPLCFGGTENNTETMPSGWRIAECSIVNRVLNLHGVRRLAHDPAAFRDVLVMHAPLRGREPATASGTTRKWRMTFGSSTAALIDAGKHPRVPVWNPYRRRVVGNRSSIYRPSSVVQNVDWLPTNNTDMITALTGSGATVASSIVPGGTLVVGLS
ncbi:MAG TPA: LamG-like jellyroll fold domain-containing protein [Gemmatimonas sp.]|nr:LamG-like jellyroll fold domain-containing protein [Gemmatimonas sp.]